MSQRATFDASLALTWSNQILGEGNPAAFFLAPTRFVVAYATVDSFSLTIGGDQIFGMGLGPNAHLVPQWQRFTLDHSTGLTLAQSLLPTDEWDFYSLNTEY